MGLKQLDREIFQFSLSIGKIIHFTGI